MMADGPATSVQTLFTSLIAGHVVRLLTNLVVNNAPVADIINLLHVLTTSAASNHARAVYLWQLQGRLAWVTYQAHVVRIVLSTQM